MKSVHVTRPGGPEVLSVVDVAVPALQSGDVLIRVAAAGVNRPDIQQRRGLYPPPANASPVLGLDVAGVVEAAADDVAWPRAGDRVCALTNGGGYAEFCAVPAVQCMPLPRGFGFVEAAALPEAFFTVWNSLIWLGRLGEGETLLVQGGSSGVGMAAIQIARALRRATVIATAGTDEKCRVCREIGAAAAIDYTTQDWASEVRTITGGRGVDVVLDGQAGPYTERELSLLAEDGRVVLLASHLGATAEVNVRNIVRRRLTLTGATLRPRPPAYKGRIARELIEQVWPLLELGEVRVHVCATFPLAEVAQAHAVLDRNEQIGKVVLTVDATLCRQPENGKIETAAAGADRDGGVEGSRPGRSASRSTGGNE